MNEDLLNLGMFELQEKLKCWCHKCYEEQVGVPNYRWMVLCPTCGNKRCPKATDHKLECTNSNKPNQEGSYY